MISKVSQNERVIMTIMWARSGLKDMMRSANVHRGERPTSFVAHLVRCPFEYGDSEQDEADQDASLE